LGNQTTKGTLNTDGDADIVFLDDDLYIQRVFVRGIEVELIKKHIADEESV
jgi:N-acetylglucosamine-6-phosphate deacetylase